MPLATVQIWEGVDRARKQKLIEALRAAMIKYGGLDPEEIYIVVQDLSRDSYTIKNVLSSEDTLTCATVRGCSFSGQEGCLLKQGKNCWETDHGCPLNPCAGKHDECNFFRHVQLMEVVNQ
ncbi:tautomerase family protein [Moorella sp. Hama-1]|uniref:tautomerase family protein n=1 Tax=Moorella sp. Hama-1 TaxID=2138101 RepID=UPI000D641D6C|nr:tautomerase family protein [Moorella sp. Hama-1]MDN5362790.1 hypothetical protein [Moorella sp. (in: firmicutes)]BCV22835.1 4-oxalocrotonate tautomerase [Moorella sp. Hama-1]